MPRGLVAIPFLCRRLYWLAKDYNVRACSESLGVSSSLTAGLEAKLTIGAPCISRIVKKCGHSRVLKYPIAI